MIVVMIKIIAQMMKVLMIKIIVQMMKAVMIKIIVQMMMFANGGSIYGPIAIEVILPSARFKKRPKKVTN